MGEPFIDIPHPVLDLTEHHFTGDGKNVPAGVVEQVPGAGDGGQCDIKGFRLPLCFAGLAEGSMGNGPGISHRCCRHAIELPVARKVPA